MLISLICKRGHLRAEAGRTAAGACLICVKEGRKRYCTAHPEYRKNARARWYKKYRVKIIKKNFMYEKKNPGKTAYDKRARAYKVKYGITIEQYEKAFRLQNGMCIICLRSVPGIKLVVDHVHPKKGVIDDGRVRGLLCLWCNHKRVGRYRAEHAPMLRRIADYLESSFDIRSL